MKKLFILTAVITVLTLNTGCNRKDKIAPISVIGSWYAEYDKDGTFYDYGAGDDVSYKRVIQFYQFVDEKTGYWTEFLFCEGSTYPYIQYGGLAGLEYADGAFTYTVNDDGTILVTLINSLEDNFWTLKASTQKITGTDEGVNYTLVRASENQINLVKRWDDEFHGGSAEDEYLFTDVTDDPATQPSN
ncbi:MAG: hypothetical protein J6W42_01255 [Bacteroidaceae bacterium]|nr:hypothetical protein [Bacteroidaceae bacterium]